MKKALSLVISILILLSIVSCSQNISVETTGTTAADSVETTTSETIEETSEETLEETTETTSEGEIEYLEGYDPITEKIGSYVILEYNPMYCSVNSKVSKSVGSKEYVELTIEMKNGYIFDGWSVGNYACNDSKISLINFEKYTILLNDEKKVFVNCSMNVIYDANGGKTSEGKDILETTYSVSEYKCPSTLPDQGQFSREGYVLSEYNTSPDGSGKAVSLGSKIRSDSSTLKLYCIWFKTDEPSDFEYTETDTVAIKKYIGSSKDVVIPEKINGKSVTLISKKAFENSSVETVFIPKTVETVEMGAFYKCPELKEIVFFDNIKNIFDNSVAECPNFKNIRINAYYDLYYVGWITGTYCKVDRIIWAENMKKFIFYGGSGSMYGIRSSMVNDEIGDEYVVINYGANANVSSAFAFEGIMKWLHEGDIMMWHPEASACPVGSSIMNGSLGRRNFEFYVCSNYDFLKGVDITKYSDFFSTMMIVFKEHSDHTTNWDHGSLGYNCYGDAEDHKAHEEVDNTYYLNFFGGTGDFSRMSWVIDEMKKKGVQVWFSFGVMDEDGKGLDEETVNEYIKNIKERFDVTIISELSTCLVPHEYIADSKWHLTKEGAILRTEKLLVDIMKQMEKLKAK